MTSFGAGTLYIEEYDNNGFKHILLTPTSAYTKERYAISKRGLPITDAEKKLKEMLSDYPKDCTPDVTFCFDAKEAEGIYLATRRLNPDGKFTEEAFLLLLGERLRKNEAKEGATKIYLDYLAWFPKGTGVVEANYNLARLTYPPEAIQLQKTPLLDETKQKIEQAKTYASDAVDQKAEGNLYWEHAHYIKGLYELALGEMDDARKDILMYKELRDQRLYFFTVLPDDAARSYGKPRYDLDSAIADVSAASHYVLAQNPPAYRSTHAKLSHDLRTVYDAFHRTGFHESVLPSTATLYDPKQVVMDNNEDAYPVYQIFGDALPEMPSATYFDEELIQLDTRYQTSLMADLMTVKILAQRYKLYTLLAETLKSSPTYTQAQEQLTVEEKTQLVFLTGHASSLAYYENQRDLYKMKLVNWNKRLLERYPPLTADIQIDLENLESNRITATVSPLTKPIPISIWIEDASIQLPPADSELMQDYFVIAHER